MIRGRIITPMGKMQNLLCEVRDTNVIPKAMKDLNFRSLPTINATTL